MTYDKDKLEKQAIKIIEANENVVFYDDVIAKLPCVSSTFYDHEMEKSESIKEALEKNKVNAKQELRKKWRTNDNATLQIALYKLISTNNELDKLAGQRIDHTTKGDKITSQNLPDELLAQAYEKYLEEQNGDSQSNNQGS